jgi:hypothetical protein
MSNWKALSLIALLALFSGCEQKTSTSRTTTGGADLAGNEKKSFLVTLVPDPSFGGYIMTEPGNTCSYTLEIKGKCQVHGLLGLLGTQVTYEAHKGDDGRVFGYCSYEGVQVPVQATFTAGQSYPTLYPGDRTIVGLFYPPMISREVPPEAWPTPAPCKENGHDMPADPAPEN